MRYYREPGFPAVAAYVNRATYLLGEGRPAAQIGLYIPSSSFWLADPARSRELNHTLLVTAHELIEHQRDFDFVDEQALSSSVLSVKKGELVNLSGQGYRAIIVPPSLAISHAALAKLRAFAAAGGKVIFLGAPPALVVGKNFLNATGPADISWAALHETAITIGPATAPVSQSNGVSSDDDPAPDTANVLITPRVLAALPAPDLALSAASPLVSYNHRRLRDADVYFIFNSSKSPARLEATLAGSGAAQVWDANTGRISALAGAMPAKGVVRVPLELAPWATTIIVIGSAPATVAIN